MGIRLLREKKTLKAMVDIYCSGNKHSRRKPSFCKSCSDLVSYAHERLDNCAFGEEKPVCALCPIHCYRVTMRAKVVRVMRYAGPKMLMHHPFLALSHLFREKLKPRGKLKKYMERRQLLNHAC